jgi:hypothetical protein
MSIVKLRNPKTTQYHNIKKLILSNVLSWTYLKETTPSTNNLLYEYEEEVKKYIKEGVEIHNPPMYSHTFLLRSNSRCLYPKEQSEYMYDINEMYCDILNSNMDHIGKSFGMMCRCNANAVEPSPKKHGITKPHLDHEFPHKNMLIYLTDAGGSTFVEGEEFAPEEDDVIMFEGMHWHELPREERRVVLVMTYV